MYVNHAFPEFAAAVNTAATLRELMTVVSAAREEMSYQDWQNLDLSDLPTFGGEAPSQTFMAWSWDEDNVLAGNGPSDWEIVPRSEFAQ